MREKNFSKFFIVVNLLILHFILCFLVQLSWSLRRPFRVVSILFLVLMPTDEMPIYIKRWYSMESYALHFISCKRKYHIRFFLCTNVLQLVLEWSWSQCTCILVVKYSFLGQPEHIFILGKKSSSFFPLVRTIMLFSISRK